MHDLGTMCFVVHAIYAAATLWGGAHTASPVPSIPEQVHALGGSCVVIPCSYTPADSRALEATKRLMHVRMRFKDGGRFFPFPSTAFNSENTAQVNRLYQGRTSFTGLIADGDCSVQIDRLTSDDTRDFEVALKGDGELLWSKPKSFALRVSDVPEAPVISAIGSATEGQLVTLNCTISIVCPATPPTLQWHWERGQGNSSEKREVQWAQRAVLVATLSFTASYRVQPRLRCEAVYPDGKRVSSSKDLHVSFPPKEIKVQVESLRIHEGASALLVCVCKADPPVLHYHWSYTQHGRTVKLQERMHKVRLYNVTRDMRVRCTAHNRIGQGESRLTALDVQYKPVIRPPSTCGTEGLDILCQCEVNSNPRPAVTWSVNGSVPPSGYNISVTWVAGSLTAVLRGHMDTRLRVICFAVNALGNDSLILLREEGVTGSILSVVILAVVFCLTIFIISLLLLYWCRKKAVKHSLSTPPVVDPEELAFYQSQMPLYINCTEVTHVYTNGSYQLVYQNCTPLFVRTKQTLPIIRRGGERRRRENRGVERPGELGARPTTETQSTGADEPDTAIYLEIL